MQMIPETIVAEGDLRAVRGTVRGAHTGEFMGMPATGRSFEVQFMDSVRIRDGRVVEHWRTTDSAAMMQQRSPLPGGWAVG